MDMVYILKNQGCYHEPEVEEGSEEVAGKIKVDLKKFIKNPMFVEQACLRLSARVLDVLVPDEDLFEDKLEVLQSEIAQGPVIVLGNRHSLIFEMSRQLECGPQRFDDDFKYSSNSAIVFVDVLSKETLELIRNVDRDTELLPVIACLIDTFGEDTLHGFDVVSLLSDTRIEAVGDPL